jgi:PTH1 family peptidyl-tRNA hydrolase
MKLIVGLGNPGKSYLKNRHNIGYIVVDELLKGKLPKNVVVKKSGEFMNMSGKYVKEIVERYNINMPNLWVIHDDLDIALGSYKIQKGKGPKQHKGIISIEKEFGEDNFWRVRVGVENRKPEDNISGEKYVLEDFSNKEEGIINEVIGKIVEELINIK